MSAALPSAPSPTVLELKLSKGSNAQLTAPHSTLPLYTVTAHIFKSRLTFSNLQGELGEVTYHDSLPLMTLRIRDAKIEMKHRGMLGPTYGFTSLSPELRGKTLTWMRHGKPSKRLSHVLQDEHQSPVARLTSNRWSLRKLGQIEFVRPVDDWARDEIAMSATTLVYHLRRRANTVSAVRAGDYRSLGGLGALNVALGGTNIDFSGNYCGDYGSSSGGDSGGCSGGSC